MQTLGWIKRWMIPGLVVLLLGCATSEDVQILDEDIRRFQSQFNLMQSERDTLKIELSTLQRDQQSMERNILTLRTDLNNEMKKIQTDLLFRLENLQSEMRTLTTGLEEYKEFSKRPSKDIDRMKEDIEDRLKNLEEKGRGIEEKNKVLEGRFEEKLKEIGDRLKGLEGKVAELSSKSVELEKPPPTKEVPTKEALEEVKGVSVSIGNLYKDAYETFRKGSLEGARRKFEVFLKQYPNTELSDNAQFWIGETYYLKKDFERAILEYEKAIVKYPEGDKIPAALFKQALAFLELGDKTNGRNLLRRVIERYPHSDQAEMAQKRLDTIK